MIRRYVRILAIGGLLSITGCSGGTADDVLECASGETIESVVVVAKGRDVVALATSAFTQFLGQEPDEVEAEGKLFVAVVDGRRIAVAEPVTSGDSYTIDRIDVCRSS